MSRETSVLSGVDAFQILDTDGRTSASIRTAWRGSKTPGATTTNPMDEIKSAFDQLQLELSLEVNEAMSQTRQKLLEYFDDEVREKLKIRDEDTKVHLDRFEHLLMRLTQRELLSEADFRSTSSFELRSRPSWTNGRDIPLGLYESPRRSGDAHLYRLNHPLGEAIVERAKARKLSPVQVTFDYTNHAGRRQAASS